MKNRQRIRTATAPLTVLGTGQRGVLIGIGALVDVPVITPIQNGSSAPVKSAGKMFIWNADKNVWTYAFLSKGLPKQGTSIGLAQRSKIVFYKVTQTTTRIIKLVIDKRQVYARGSQEGDFSRSLTFDVSVFTDNHNPVWFKSLPLDTEAKKSRVLDNDTLRNLFMAAKDLAAKAHKLFKSDSKSVDNSGDASIMEDYTKAMTDHGGLKGRMDSLSSLESWLESYDGDPRTVASIKRHLEREKESIKTSLNEAEKKVEALRKRIHQTHPGMKAAQFRLRAIAKVLKCPLRS